MCSHLSGGSSVTEGPWPCAFRITSSFWRLAVTVLGEPARKAVSSVSKVPCQVSAVFPGKRLGPLSPYCVGSDILIEQTWLDLKSCAVSFSQWKFLGLFPHHDPREMSTSDLRVSIYPLARHSVCSWAERHTKIALKMEKTFGSGGSPEVQRAKGQWDTRQVSLPKALIRFQIGRGHLRLLVKR